MKFKLKKLPGPSLERLIADIPSRIENLSRVIGQGLAERAVKTVNSKLLDPTPWIKVYSRSITFRETADGLNFAVVGLSESPLSKVDASTTLVKFTNTEDQDDPGISELVVHSPWAVDQIPPFVFNGTAVSANANPDEVMMARERNNKIKDQVTTILKNLNLPKSASGFPIFKNGEYSDIKFMARAMELGITGHKKTVHWSVAANKIGDYLGRLPSSIKQNGQKALNGVKFSPIVVMSDEEAEKFSKIRSSTWA